MCEAVKKCGLNAGCGFNEGVKAGNKSYGVSFYKGTFKFTPGKGPFSSGVKCDAK